MEIESQIPNPSSKTSLPVNRQGKFDRESLLIFSKLYPNAQIELDEKGNLIIMAPTTGNSGRRSAKFLIKLAAWDSQNGEPGELFDSSTGFTLPNSAVRSPDAAWLEKSRWNALADTEKDSYPQIVPDLVAEVRSKTDNFPDTLQKCRMWLAQGATEVWCIDPGQQIILLRAGQELTFQANETASSQLLPGFEIKASELN